MWKDILRLQVDFGLAMTELGYGLALSRRLDRVCAKGNDSQPVMVIPGFTAPEQSMAYLSRFLNRNGFVASSWGLGANKGPGDLGFAAHVEQLADKMRSQVEILADRHDQGVSLIGHSLGGVYARELALRLQPYIDRVITLGAPIFPAESLQQHNAIIRRMGELQTGRPLDEVFVGAGTSHWPAHQPEIPCVAIYSPVDGAVGKDFAAFPQASVMTSREPAIRENVRILSSHSGMAVNPLVLLTVADRLVADTNHWLNFDPACYRDLLSLTHRKRLSRTPT